MGDRDDGASASSGEDQGPAGRPDLVARLLDDPARARVLDYAAAYLNATFDRPLEVLGDRVGVTVFPGGDPNVLLRINGGWQTTTSISRSGPDLIMAIALVTDGDEHSLEPIRAMVDGEVRDGFKRVIDNRSLRFRGIDRALALLGNPDAARRAREFMDDVSRRRLAQPNWHNPALDELLDPLLHR